MGTCLNTVVDIAPRHGHADSSRLATASLDIEAILR
jgi:hypothetical protein